MITQIVDGKRIVNVVISLKVGIIFLRVIVDGKKTYVVVA